MLEAWDENGKALANVEVCHEGACSDVPLGQALDRGTVMTERGQSLKLRRGNVLVTLAADSALGVEPSRLVLERGAAVLSRTPEANAEATARPAATARVGASELTLPQGRWSEVRVERSERSTRFEVRRGQALVETDGVARTLERGQEMAIERDEEPAVAFASLVSEPRGASAPLPASEPRNEASPPEEPTLRGLGRMTARRPGQEATVGGVTLASHQVHVEIRDGVASTTVEEIFENETNEVLEGRLVFPVPSAASVSDLSLWVGDRLVPAEMVEKRSAATIFKGIVDDTVRPRDPALLEWKEGHELSLSIFPLPAKGTRKVQLSFEQPVSDLSGRGTFVYPLSHDAARATKVKFFSLSVKLEGRGLRDVVAPLHDATITTGDDKAEVRFEAKDFVPSSSFVVSYRSDRASDAELTLEPAAPSCEHGCPPALDGAGVLRTAVALDAEDPLPAPVEGDRVFVLDKSASQTRASLAAQVALVRAALEGLSEERQIALVACDSACVSFPESGRVSAREDAKEAALKWAAALEPSGSSDLGGALDVAADHLAGAAHAQLVVLGDGVASSGELRPATIARRARQSLPDEVDVRVVGVGRNVDATRFAALADELAGTYQELDLEGDLEESAVALALSLDQPLLRDVEVELPAGLALAAPAPRALRLGDELRLATVRDGATGGAEESVLQVRGHVGDATYELARALRTQEGPPGFASRAVARAVVDDLSDARAPDERAIVELSKRYFVMTRLTSMLVLENDAMFSAFGIPRTRRESDGASAWPFETPPILREPSRGAWEQGGAHVPKMPAVRMGGLPDRGEGIGLGSIGTIGHGAGDGSGMGAAFGAGGLGLSGIGEGGGGRGEGIGLGNAESFGAGIGRLGASHKSEAPRVRMGATTVSGRLPPEVIQRIVRQNFGRFRLCYENELRRTPELAGRVTVKFTITREGSVTAISGRPEGVPNTMSQCVARGFAQLSFPSPDGGTVNVTYPINFSPAGGGPTWRSSPPPSATITDGNDGWIGADKASVFELESALTKAPEKRSAHAALIRKLIKTGRFADAAQRARSYAAIDPDRTEPRDLLAQALLASGDVDHALSTLDELAELNHDSVDNHRRIAMAFEASGDERRACAHWRSVADLAPGDLSGVLEALRCRGRALGEREAVQRELDARVGVKGVDSRVLALSKTLAAGSLPAFTAPRTEGGVTVESSCTLERAQCPFLISIDANGNVVSERLPSARVRPFVDSWSVGRVRTMLVGGSPDAEVKVTVRAGGLTRTQALRRRERSTVATVDLVPMGFGTGF